MKIHTSLMEPTWANLTLPLILLLIVWILWKYTPPPPMGKRNEEKDWREFKDIEQVQGYLARRDWYKTLNEKLLKDIEDAKKRT